MKKKIAIMWILTALCFISAVVFWFLMNNSKVTYTEVDAVVTSTGVKQVINKSTGNKTDFYEVKVEYNGEEYELQNVHGLAGYYKGKTVKALLSNNKLYANVEGIKSTSPVATVYFVFLFGTLIMLTVSASYTSKAKKQKQKNQITD